MNEITGAKVILTGLDMGRYISVKVTAGPDTRTSDIEIHLRGAIIDNVELGELVGAAIENAIINIDDYPYEKRMALGDAARNAVTEYGYRV